MNEIIRCISPSKKYTRTIGFKKVSQTNLQDPMDADLVQWAGCSKMSSGQMEALIRLHGDAVEVQVRGPCEIATSCFYFLEDITNLVEQAAQEVAPGISLERHFLSPKHLRVSLPHFSQPLLVHIVKKLSN